MVKFRRSSGVKICCFIDDCLGTNSSAEVTKMQSDLVQSVLHQSGFLVDKMKIIWEPFQITTWLGNEVNLMEGFFRISEPRESSILGGLATLITHAPYSSARKFSRVLSTKFVLGNIVRHKTKQLYKIINNRVSWDARCSFA